jgi:hypothetical protein
MIQKIDIDSLTTCLVTPDGARIRLNFGNIAGHATTLDLSTSLVQQLVKTLPHLLSTALRVQHGDNCARDPQGSIAWALQ